MAELLSILVVILYFIFWGYTLFRVLKLQNIQTLHKFILVLAQIITQPIGVVLSWFWILKKDCTQLN